MELVSHWALLTVLSDTFAVMVIMFLIVGALEYFIPARAIPGRHYAFNIAYALVNVFFVVVITAMFSLGIASAIQSFGLGFIDLRALGLDGIGGSLFAVLVGALIWDFFGYWQHRLEHRSQILWQQHLLHHSDEHMNVTTGARLHLFETILTPTLTTIPAAILFKLPAADIAVMSLVPYTWSYLSHANINLGFGPFWWLLVSPNYHRVHHSLTHEHIDKNFVQWFPVWDIVFGTAVVPRWRECPATGVAGVSVRTLPQAYLLPFKGWLRMIATARASRSREPARFDEAQHSSPESAAT